MELRFKGFHDLMGAICGPLPEADPEIGFDGVAEIVPEL